MNWKIEFTREFVRGAKILKKRYKSFISDLELFKNSIMENPYQGAELVPGIRKIRMSVGAKGKGKSGGARVITLTYHVSREEGKVYFLLIYDKSDADTVDVEIVKKMVIDLGFDLEALQKESKSRKDNP